jgi:hypothetical protein
MTLPKKGTRTLELDGETYRWRLGRTSEGDTHTNLAVENPDGQVWTACVRIRGVDGTPKPFTTKDVIAEIQRSL